jgi:uncharacterized membrane protein
MKTYLVIRVVHIVSTGIWLGMALMSALFMMPAIGESGPEGGKVMAAMQKRGLVSFVPIIATFSIASGLWLYWRYTAGFSPEMSRTPSAMAFGAGGALGILAYLIGIPIGPSLARAKRLSVEAASMPEGADRASRLATADRLRRRALISTRIAAALILITSAIMSVSLFV